MIKNVMQRAFDHRFWRYAVVTAPNYYYLSWAILVTTSLSLAWMSHATTVPPLLASIALSAVCIVAHRRMSSRGLRSARIAGYAVCMLILLWAFTGQRQDKDFAVIAMEMLLAALPALMQNMGAQRRVFAAISVANLIALGAVMLSDNLDTYGAFLAFIVAMAMTLNASRMYFLSVNAGDATERLTVNFFYQLVRAVPIGIIFGSMIFYWFPRINELALDLNLSGVKSRTGYSNQVNLGGKGSIEESNRVSLWVSSRDLTWLANNGPGLYLRGSALDSFDGEKWTSSAKLGKLAMKTADFRVGKANAKEQRDIVIFKEPTGTRELLVPYGLWNLDMPFRLNQEIFVDGNGAIILIRDGSLRYHYDVRFSPALHSGIDLMVQTLDQYRSEIAQSPEEAKRFFELTATDAIRLRQVPETISSQPWFKDFSRRLSGDLGAPEGTQPISTILRNIQRHFRANYKASLRFEFSGEDNLKQFLDSGKEGHCELFATSAALYLRSLGVPARLVAGYHGGQFNYVSNMLEVAERNAHVWLEVFYPGTGWIPYDPTPLMLQAGQRSAVEEAVTAVFNAVRFWFIRYVIDYDSKAQKELFVSVSRVDMSKLLDAKKVSWDQNTVELTVMLALLAISGWLLLRVLTRDDQLPDAPKYYRALAARLQAAGFTRKKGESYLEFHRRLVDENVNPDLVAAAHRALERDLYGARGLTRPEQRALHNALRKMPLRQKLTAIRQNGPSPQSAHG